VPDLAAVLEIREHLDTSVDGERTALAGVIDDNVVPGADLLLAQHGPDHVEQPNDVGAEPPAGGGRPHRGERTRVG
jgi:hypothetical protein